MENENKTDDQVAEQSLATEQKKYEPWEITPEERAGYEAKCLELAAKHKVPKVHCCVLLKVDDPTFERLVAYIKEPDYIAKLTAIDKSRAMGPHIAAEQVRLLNQITEESHPWTYSDLFEFEKYKLGVAQFCISIIEISVDQLKKN